MQKRITKVQRPEPKPRTLTEKIVRLVNKLMDGDLDRQREYYARTIKKIAKEVPTLASGSDSYEWRLAMSYLRDRASANTLCAISMLDHERLVADRIAFDKARKRKK